MWFVGAVYSTIWCLYGHKTCHNQLSFSISAHAFRCRNWRRIWLWHHSWHESVIWLTHWRLKSQQESLNDEGLCGLQGRWILLYGVWTAIKPLTINFVSICAYAFGCRIRWRIWFWHQSWHESMIWLTHWRSKSKQEILYDEGLCGS
jgi:hypothetical protein